MRVSDLDGLLFKLIEYSLSISFVRSRMESVRSASRGDTLNTYPPWKKKGSVQFSSVQ